MTNFTNREQKRFGHAVKLVKSLKECAEKGNNLQLMWQGDLIKPSQIKIEKNMVVVEITSKYSHSRHIIYDETCVINSMKDTEKMLREDFKLLREISW